MKLSDIARECLERDGQSMRNKPLEEIAKRALGLSTGDFTNILANVSNKSMAKGYTEAGTTYQRWCGMMALSDFKTATIAKLSSVGDVSEVGEGQPFKQVKSVDDKESVTLKTYGSNFVISRQAIVNDDLGALSRTPAALAQSIRRKINSLAYGVLTANAAMNDGVTLFHSTHKNVGSTAAISNTTITEAVKLMGLQTDPNGSRLNLRPKYLLVCKNKESIALQQLNANVPITYVSAASVDVYRGQVEIISDAVLDGTSTSATMYYFAADQNIIDTVTIFNLNGIDAPTFEMAESSGAEPLGVTYRIYMDVTAAAIDHRGLVYNAGA
jgi:phage major head subunit gpT-like protein